MCFVKFAKEQVSNGLSNYTAFELFHFEFEKRNFGSSN